MLPNINKPTVCVIFWVRFGRNIAGATANERENFAMNYVIT